MSAGGSPGHGGRYRRSARARWLLHAGHHLADLAHPWARRLLPLRPRIWWIPRLPTSLRPFQRSPAVPWARFARRPPAALRTAAGIRRDAQAQARAAAQTPLYDFFNVHEQVRTPDSPMSHMWPSMLSAAPGLFGAARRRGRDNRRAAEAGRTARPVASDPAELTAALRAESARLGISALGVTTYDEKFNFVEYRGRAVGTTVVVALLEQNFDSTQLIPSMRSERAALSTYAELENKMVSLARWLRERGHTARPEGFAGESMAIAYAVEAGLGQLGLNGQLLTPHAGSRVRIHVMTTDAPLTVDAPVDYGLEGVCDACQVCVRRCPPGAIPATRKEHRGVVKAKLNTKRCLPVVGKAAGCSICMKVCPVQRYGLEAVLEEFESSGRILGKSTDDLEGYDWPIDGRHYGPGESPRLEPSFFETEGFTFDPTRTEPVGDPGETAHGRLSNLGY